MKPNINDVSELQDLKRALAEKNVSPTAITTLERALKRGMSFKRVEDLGILDIPTVDVGALGEAVVFGPVTTSETNVKTVEYRFDPIGDQAAFFGYQLIVTFVNNSGFTIEEAYPIEDSNVIVDYDLAVLRAGSPVTLHVNTASGSRAKLKLHGAAAEAGELVEIPATDLANALIDINV